MKQQEGKEAQTPLLEKKEAQSESEYKPSEASSDVKPKGFLCCFAPKK